MANGFTLGEIALTPVVEQHHPLFDVFEFFLGLTPSFTRRTDPGLSLGPSILRLANSSSACNRTSYGRRITPSWSIAASALTSIAPKVSAARQSLPHSVADGAGDGEEPDVSAAVPGLEQCQKQSAV